MAAAAYPSRSRERMREYRRAWAKRDRIKRAPERRMRARRIRIAKQQHTDDASALMAEGKCLNCHILIAERADYVPQDRPQPLRRPRAYIYCRKCIEEHPKEVSRHKWRRYYYRYRDDQLVKMRARSKARYHRAKAVVEAVV